MTTRTTGARPSLGTSLMLAGQALRLWTSRQVLATLSAAVVIAVLIGLATVLIPNPIFARDIPPVWWNYPLWLVTSALSGMLVATYVRDGPAPDGNCPERDGSSGAQGDAAAVDERRTNRMGLAGGVMVWFAVGCPLCNKLALLALGYSGAITWFTPIQPLLGVGALALTSLALVWRLRGQVACSVPTVPNVVAR